MLNQKTSSDLDNNSKKVDEKNAGPELTKPPVIFFPKVGALYGGLEKSLLPIRSLAPDP